MHENKNEESLKTIFNGMKAWEQRALKLIAVHYASQLFDVNTLIKLAEHYGLSGAEVKVSLANLSYKGIISAKRKHWGEKLYCLPKDSFVQWQSLLMEPSNPWEEISDSQIDYIVESPAKGITDLFMLLNYIGHNEIILTRKEEIPKQHLRKLSQHLQGWEEIRCIWKPGPEYRDVYHGYLALAIELAEQLQLIQWNKHKLTLQRTNIKIWLKLTKSEMSNRIYSIFRDGFIPGNAAEAHFLTKLVALTSEKWYLREDFTTWLQEYDIIIMFNSWMGLLEAFGWIEHGIDAKARKILRIKLDYGKSLTQNKSPGKFYVQADYEILVPPDVPFNVRWELSYMADHIHTDQVGVYRLSLQAMRRALRNGRTLLQCLDFLNEESYYGVAETVQLALEQWNRSIPSVAIKPAHIDSEDNAPNPVKRIQENNFYEIVCDIPSREAIYPRWQAIPPLWWRECRRYHSSTEKEIAMLAIEWETLLKLNLADEEIILIPKQVQEFESSWKLRAWTESGTATFSQGQWQGMQLILPGFNDLTFQNIELRK